MTFRLDETALAGWQAPRRSTPDGQPQHSDRAIELVLTLRLVVHLTLRQVEAVSRSVLHLLGPGLAIPITPRFPGVVGLSPVASPALSGRMPRTSAVSSIDSAARMPRSRHIRLTAKRERMAWRQASGCGRRNLVGTAIGRYRRLIDPRLRARTLLASRPRRPPPSPCSAP